VVVEVCCGGVLWVALSHGWAECVIARAVFRSDVRRVEYVVCDREGGKRLYGHQGFGGVGEGSEKFWTPESSVTRNSTMSIRGDPGYNLLVFRISHFSLVLIGVIEHPCWDVLVQGHTEGTLIGQGVKKPGDFCES